MYESMKDGRKGEREREGERERVRRDKEKVKNKTVNAIVERQARILAIYRFNSFFRLLVVKTEVVILSS